MKSQIKQQMKIISEIDNDIIKLKRFKIDEEKKLKKMIHEHQVQTKIIFDEDSK